MYTSLIGVVIILQNEEGKTLLGKRVNAYKAGFYGLPGGRVELGEALHAAASRELTEETGIKLPTFSFVGAVKEYQETRDFIHFVFSALLPPDQTVVNAEPDKCVNWEWIDPLQLPDPMVEGHAAAFELFLSQGEKRLVDLYFED